MRIEPLNMYDENMTLPPYHAYDKGKTLKVPHFYCTISFSNLTLTHPKVLIRISERLYLARGVVVERLACPARDSQIDPPFYFAHANIKDNTSPGALELIGASGF